MKYLLYCIFEKPAGRAIIVPSPEDAHCVRMLEKEDLCAVFSEVSDRDAAYDISEIMNYHKVIEWFFKQVTVIPFRFGMVLDEQADVARLLENRADQYKKVLSELEDCAEVGIRAIIDDDGMPIEGCCSAPFPSLESSNPGKLYLSSRRVHYLTETLLTQLGERVTERYRTAFDGMYKKFRMEITKTPSDGRLSQGRDNSYELRLGRPGPTDASSSPSQRWPVRAQAALNGHVSKDQHSAFMVSMYFLVPKHLLPQFRQVFLGMASDTTARSLLSGPWPPYNFVLPGDAATK